MKVKINAKAFVLSLGIFLLMTGVIIQSHISVFQYFDELFTLICLVFLMMRVTPHVNKEIMIDLVLIGLLILIGCSGNIVHGVQVNIKAIITDIGNIFKSYIAFLTFYTYFREYKRVNLSCCIIKYLNLYSRILVLPGFILAIVNLFINVGMYTEYVYGLRAFHYIFGRVGNLNTACIAILIIMTLYLQELTGKKRAIQCGYIFMTICLMVSTLRSRAFIYALVYIAGYFYFVKCKRIKVKLRYVFIIGFVALYLAMPKIEYYFMSSTKARSVLLRYGIKTALNYAPLGAGFGSYGTFSAKVYWSQLYNEYGFSNYYGLSQEWGAFLTDNYWPAIMGEFGFFGAGIMLLFVGRIYLKIIKKTTKQPITRFAALFGIVCLSISSLVSSSFFKAVGLMTIIAMAATYQSKLINNIDC